MRKVNNLVFEFWYCTVLSCSVNLYVVLTVFVYLPDEALHNILTARLTKIKKHIMKLNPKERVKELIQNNKAFSYSDFHLYMGTMKGNNKDLLETQKRIILSRGQKQKTHIKANEVAYN